MNYFSKTWSRCPRHIVHLVIALVPYQENHIQIISLLIIKELYYGENLIRFEISYLYFNELLNRNILAKRITNHHRYSLLPLFITDHSSLYLSPKSRSINVLFYKHTQFIPLSPISISRR